MESAIIAFEELSANSLLIHIIKVKAPSSCTISLHEEPVNHSGHVAQTEVVASKLQVSPRVARYTRTPVN